MVRNNVISVEIVYARPDQQMVIPLEVEAGCTIEAAILRSGLLARFPEIDLAVQKVGVFSKQRKLTDILQSGDRIEIYRPLQIDPKEARRAKAKQFHSRS